MESNERSCQMATEWDLIIGYLENRLPPAEAERFESHYFECDECWEAVQLAQELRASLSGDRGSEKPLDLRGRFAVTWKRPATRALAYAAIIAVVTIPIATMSLRTPNAPSPAPRESAIHPLPSDEFVQVPSSLLGKLPSDPAGTVTRPFAVIYENGALSLVPVRESDVYRIEVPGGDREVVGIIFVHDTSSSAHLARRILAENRAAVESLYASLRASRDSLRATLSDSLGSTKCYRLRCR